VIKPNDLFCRELRKYIPRPGMEKAYAHVLNTAYKVRTKSQREDIRSLAEQIDAAGNDIARGRQLLLKEEIDARKAGSPANRGFQSAR